MFGEIRTMTNEKGETYFVGKDVATALGYSKPLNAITMHVDEDDSLKWGLIDSKGRKQQAIFINESGLYALILSSKLPQAKAFKRWVTSAERRAARARADRGAHFLLLQSQRQGSHEALPGLDTRGNRLPQHGRPQVAKRGES